MLKPRGLEVNTASRMSKTSKPNINFNRLLTNTGKGSLKLPFSAWFRSDIFNDIGERNQQELLITPHNNDFELASG